MCDWLGRAAWLVIVLSGIALALTPAPTDPERSTASPLLSACTGALGQAITARYLDPKLPAADVFASWLQQTFFAQ